MLHWLILFINDKSQNGILPDVDDVEIEQVGRVRRADINFS